MVFYKLYLDTRGGFFFILLSSKRNELLFESLQGLRYCENLSVFKDTLWISRCCRKG